MNQTTETAERLDRILAEFATPDRCRAWNGTREGGTVRPCAGEPVLVTLACEHEHFYEVALCREHRGEAAAGRSLGCPVCRAADYERHMCRHAVVSS